MRTTIRTAACCGLVCLFAACGDDGMTTPSDAGTMDAMADTGTPDTGTPDTGSPDTGTADAGTLDSGTDSGTPDAGPTVDCTALDESITVEGIEAHLEALQSIADDNDGNRAVDTSGYEASVDYVVEQLEDAGYSPTTQTVDHPFFEQNSDPVLERTAPSSKTYTYSFDGMDPDADFQNMELSPPGDVTAEIAPVDLDLGAGNESTSGCETEDFSDFPSGSIALIQVGGGMACPYVDKALRAQEAGAVGVIIFSQGDTTERESLRPGRLVLFGAGADHGLDIPVLYAHYDVGEELAGMVSGDSAPTVHMKVDTTLELHTTENVIAETSGGADDEVVVFGGHLDSVPESAGINDNGSGVAALLEIASAVSECEPTRKLRFAWWGAEETGMWGSKGYVRGLTETEHGNLHSYINVDVIGSPNHVVFAYDGDGSDAGPPGPPGSADIEAFFRSDLLFAGLSSDEYFYPFSDHFEFWLSGVAYGGLTTGAGGIKTETQADVFGGTQDEPYDACWHMACDDIDNVDLDVARDMTASLARAAQFFGVEGSSVPPMP